MVPSGRRVLILLWALGFVLVPIACNLNPLAAPATRPSVRIVSPRAGTSLVAGRGTQVLVSGQDPSGIARLEIWVDATLVTALQPPTPQTDYTALLPWTPNAPGDHSLRARAVNRSGATGDSEVVNVSVTGSADKDTSLSAPTAIPPSPAPPAVVPSAAPNVRPSPVAPTMIPPSPVPPTPVPPTPVPPTPVPATDLPAPTEVPTNPPAPTAKPQPVASAVPAVAPGLYVTAIRLEPAEPRSKPAQFAFLVTFLNSTGAPVSIPRWRVLIYRPDGKKPMGDPRGIEGMAPPGSSDQPTQSWEIKVMGCEPFYGKAIHEDEDGRQVPFLAPDGTEVTVQFQVCP